jgi:hypothetical protein
VALGRALHGTVTRIPGARALVGTPLSRAVRTRVLGVRDGTEARWTRPRADCPHPEWWTAADADSAEAEVTELVAAFVRALQPELVLETGAAYGATAAAIGGALRRNGHGRLLTLEVDPARAAHAQRRCAGLPVEVLNVASLEYEPPAPLDFVWLDSLLELRAEEFLHFRPTMHAGTIVGFHDTGPHYEVRAAVDALAAEGLLRPVHLPTPRGATFAQVLG